MNINCLCHKILFENFILHEIQAGRIASIYRRPERKHFIWTVEVMFNRTDNDYVLLWGNTTVSFHNIVHRPENGHNILGLILILRLANE